MSVTFHHHLFTVVIIVYFSDASSQAPQNANTFFSDLTGKAMNAINPLSNIPNAMTMSKRCRFGASMSGPMNYLNMESPLGNPPNTYMGVNRGCPCLITVDSSGCPVCDCQTSKASTRGTRKPTVLVDPNRHYPSAYNFNATPGGPLVITNTIGTSKTLLPTPTNTRTKSRGYISSKANDSDENGSGDEKTPTTTITFTTPTPATMKTNCATSIVNDTSILLLVVFCCLTGCTTVASIVLFILWRKSKKSLLHQKNEIYFIQKTIRNSSIVSSLLEKQNERQRNSIYSLVGTDLSSQTELKLSPFCPELPPRTPSSTSSESPSAPPITPEKGQTKFAFPTDDIRHDYLELI